MTKGRPDPEWKGKLLDWQASGKKPRAWCLENHIPLSTFHGWKKRFVNLSTDAKLVKPQSTKIKQGFIELTDRNLPDSGIVLECHGVKIHLKAEFNPLMLRKCLDCLRGLSC